MAIDARRQLRLIRRTLDRDPTPTVRAYARVMGPSLWLRTQLDEALNVGEAVVRAELEKARKP